ncbi:hypothetical protein N7540_002378 [Penicillium herquei]|nr:hypothetical protein N7540_002378 [Penicillium herquei]
MRAFILIPFFANAVLGTTWTLGFYEKTDCEGTSPAAFGDSKKWACTNINSGSTVVSVDGPTHGWTAWLYNKDDCKGEVTLKNIKAGKCYNAEEYLKPAHYKSFRIGHNG